MDKLIIKDTILSTEHVLLSLTKPIKLLYKGIANPVFTLKANDYNLSTNKPYTTMSLKGMDIHTQAFLTGLDEIIPKIAFDRRKTWFTSDLFDVDYDSFVENYRKNISEYGFSIYLGPNDKDNLPVSCFIKDLTPNNLLSLSQKTYPKNLETLTLKNSFQELAWGNGNGQATILVQVTGLWIKEESYGLSWKILQILYRRIPRLPQGCQMFLGSKDIFDHTWRIPPDEADQVELPDEDDDENEDENEDKNINEFGSDLGSGSGLAQIEETSGIDVSALPTKPYNPLLETDD
ncbi:MAG: hypothetical protein WD512_03865 [Candidatus Paceibacterota bacterium]